MTDQFGNPITNYGQPELFSLGEQRKSAHQRRDNSSGKRSSQSPAGRTSQVYAQNPTGFNLMGNHANDTTFMSPNTRAKGMGH
jgi:hypothetical protein|tara:strand:- start:2508 stop:2756 length:249 start_codon:yes stop_codon:yes gene_type:complete